jgi:hypothetical protein
MYNHDADTDDIPDGMEPANLLKRGSAAQKLSEADAWSNYFKRKTSEAQSYAQSGTHRDDEEWDQV